MSHHPTFKSILKQKTRELLADHLKLKANSYQSVSNVTGLSPTWLAMLHKDELKQPDVGRVETLYNYLSPVKLAV